MKKLMYLGWLTLAFVTLFGLHKVAALTSARSQTANFSSATVGNSILLQNDEQITYTVVSGLDPNVGTTQLQKSCDGSNFKQLSVDVSTANNSHAGTFSATIAVENCPGGKVWYRFAETAYTSGASSTTIAEVDNVRRSFFNNNGESVMDIKDGGVVQNGYENVTGALTVTGAAALNGGVSNTTTFTYGVKAATAAFTGASVSVSSNATSGNKFVIDGAYSTAEIQAKTPSAAGQLIFNVTLGNVCISTGTTIQGYKLAGTASTTCQ